MVSFNFTLVFYGKDYEMLELPVEEGKDIRCGYAEEKIE